jgi:3-oxoacid CoA-transferase subunit A
MKKVYPDAKAALAGLLKDGMLIMAGGFGLCGIPETLIIAIRDSGVKNLTIVSNNAGVDGIGLGLLLETKQVKKMISSYVGENKTFATQFLAGELEIEFNPQGTLAERIRAGGAGIPAFFTRTGAGTDIAKGKEERVFDGERFIMERGIVADLSIVHAWRGDTEGNLAYRKTARNFNPMMATAGKVTVAEVEHLFEPGQRRQGAARRLLRQSRHRYPDVGVELHPQGHERAAPERERHARLRTVSLRGR